MYNARGARHPVVLSTCTPLVSCCILYRRHTIVINIITTPSSLITQGQILAAQSADVVTILHGLHLVPTAAALREAHRLLRPRGVLVAAWCVGCSTAWVAHVVCASLHISCATLQTIKEAIHLP